MPARLALLGGSLLATLVLVEAILHVWMPQPTYAVRYAPWGFEHIPNIAFKRSTESRETVSTVRYNRDGFRSAIDFAIPAASGTLRVAILGDSYGEGAEVEERDSHAAVLERLLNDFLRGRSGRYQRAEVVNASVYAYDTCQELRIFEERVARYRPAVVFVIYTGELLANRRFCRVVDGKLEYVDMPYSALEGRARYALGYVRAKSHLVALVVPAMRSIVGTVLPVPGQLQEPLRHERHDIVPGVSTRAAMDELRQLLYAIVDRLHASVEARGGALYLVGSPELYGLDDHAARRGIVAFDVFGYVERRRRGPAYLPLDGHWNQHGHALVAEGMFEVVRDHYLRAAGRD